jgi:hypothetical protein
MNAGYFLPPLAPERIEFLQDSQSGLLASILSAADLAPSETSMNAHKFAKKFGPSAARTEFNPINQFILECFEEVS